MAGVLGPSFGGVLGPMPSFGGVFGGATGCGTKVT